MMAASGTFKMVARLVHRYVSATSTNTNVTFPLVRSKSWTVPDLEQQSTARAAAELVRLETS